jgi:purine-binding chemotaxis protein CheW
VEEATVSPIAPPASIIETAPEQPAVKKTAAKEMPAPEKAVETPVVETKSAANLSSPAAEIKEPAPAPTPQAEQAEAEKVASLIDDLQYADDEHLVVFRLNDQVYGVSIMVVESIIKNQAITPVPRAPFSIVGVTNLRGIVLPVINMHQRLGLEELENSPHTRIIIINKSDISAGLMVDEVLAVAKIDASSITPPSPVIYKTQTQFIKGIAKFDSRLVILLDLDKVFEAIANRAGAENMKRAEK